MRTTLKAWPVVLIIFLALAVGTGWWYQKTPQGFLPDEDQGYVVIAVQLPDAASIDRTTEVTNRMNNALRDTPGVENWFVLGGFSLLDNTAAPNSATAFAAWKDWKYRGDPKLSARGTRRAASARVWRNARRVCSCVRAAGHSGVGVCRRVPDADRRP